MLKDPLFYKLVPEVNTISPTFKSTNKVILFFKTFRYLRYNLSSYKPDAVLSFGTKYNSFTLLTTLGLNLKIYVSDRSSPLKNSSYKNFKNQNFSVRDYIVTLSKRILYPFSKGIIAQTDLAKKYNLELLKHRNICVIGNPITPINLGKRERENIILNVGRFIPSKNQLFLLNAFYEIGNFKWKLFFAGDGPYKKKVEEAAVELGINHHVHFLGKVQDVKSLYSKSKIFAFTSRSEGFPNALAEALSTPSCFNSF